MYQLTTLPNGLTVIREQIPSVRSIAFGIWIKSGSRNESARESGISHFIEHMLFKGTSRRSAKDIADEMDAIGGQANAYTAKEYTCYHTRTLDSHFGRALDILADMFFHSRFDGEDIRKERGVIGEEISMYEDTPEELVHDLLQAAVWQADPLGQPILGTGESIAAFDTPDFLAYLQSHYLPANTVLAVAGHFDEEELLDQLAAQFGAASWQGDWREPAFAPVYRPGVVTKEKDAEQVHLTIGFPSMSLGDDDTYPLAVLNTVFGGGMSSRLFQTIREERGLAYSVYSYNSSFADTGLFTIYAGLNPSQVKDVFGLVEREIERLSSDPITPPLLERAKEQMKSGYLLGLESTNNRMNSLGRNQLMLRRALTPDEVIAKIEAVDVDALDRVARRVFVRENMSLCAVGNLGKWDYEGLAHGKG